MSRVALALARQGGNLSAGQTEGYDSAIVRVSDPVALTDVRTKITDLGFGSFSIVDELDQIRTVFLIFDSVLGLLGGISLLVASFGIANTMIMSILERTREIGIMFGSIAGMQNAVKTEAKLEFKLFAVGEQAPRLSSSASAKEEGDENSAGTALDSEARAVVTEVKKKRG